MRIRQELLPEGWTWWRIAERSWRNPLDPEFARQYGGRWNPPGSFATLYLNEDQVTARLNLRAFIARWPYEPEDLRSDTGPILAGAVLPRNQTVCDAHTRPGTAALGLPPTYPLDSAGKPVRRDVCQPIGQAVNKAGLRGVRARSTQTRHGAGRELAWFPATSRSVARLTATLKFDDWFWA